MKIPDTKLLSVYYGMVNRLAKVYPKRFWIWLGVFHRELDKEVVDAEDVVNDVWVRCNSGDATLMEFLRVLRVYEGLVLRGFGLYNTAMASSRKIR